MTTILLLAIIKHTNNFVTNISECKTFSIGVFPYTPCQEIQLWMKAYEYLRLSFLKKRSSSYNYLKISIE